MAKKTLESAIGFNEIRNRLLFTEIALELAGADGDKEVAALGAPIGKLHTRWQDLLSMRHQQERQQVRANALCKRRNLLLDGVLKTIHNATLSAADQQRNATLFTHLFPKPLSTLTKPALEGQIKVAEAFVERLAKSDAHAALRKLYAMPPQGQGREGCSKRLTAALFAAPASAQSGRAGALPVLPVVGHPAAPRLRYFAPAPPR